jgi:small subunit ribosomal protein S7e
LSKTEEAFAKSLGEIENTTTEFKKDIKNFFLDSVKEVEVFSPSQQKVHYFLTPTYINS